MAVGVWCRIRQHRLRLRTIGRRCTPWGNWKPTHRFVSQFRLRRSVLDQIILIGLVQRGKVDRKASVLVCQYIGYTLTLPREADCSVEEVQLTETKTSLRIETRNRITSQYPLKVDDEGRLVKPQQKSGTRSMPSQANRSRSTAMTRYFRCHGVIKTWSPMR